MKQALRAIVLAAFLPAAAFAQNATDFTVRTKSFNGTLGVVIMGYQGAPRTVVIPARFNGIPVMEIGDQAFMLNDITSVVIPRTVLRIGRQAFYGNKLAEVNIPESVREIGDNAFDSNLNFRTTRASEPAAAVSAREARFDPAPTPIPVRRESPISDAAAPGYQPPARRPLPAPLPVVTPPRDGEDAARPSAAESSPALPAKEPVRAAAPRPSAAVPPALAAKEPPPRPRIVMPEEKRVFEVNETIVIPDDGSAPDVRDARRRMNPPIQNEYIPQRYAKAPPPLAASTPTYSAVIPPQTEAEKYPITEVTPVSDTVLGNTGGYTLSVSDRGVYVISAFNGPERELTVPAKIGAYTPTVVGKLAFWNKYLLSVKLPNTIVRIEDSAFASNSLTHVVVPESVRYIGYQAFNGNPIQRVTIGSAVPMQTDSFPALFADFYRINGMIAGTYFLASGKWYIDK